MWNRVKRLLVICNLTASAVLGCEDPADLEQSDVTQPPDTLYLAPVDSAGHPEQSGDWVFGTVRDICTLGSGLIAVVDGVRPAVFVLDSSFSYVDTLARIGSGPGEFTGITCVCGMSDGGLQLLSVADWKCIRYSYGEEGFQLESEVLFGESFPPSAISALSTGGFAGVARTQAVQDSLGFIAAVWSSTGQPDVILRRRLAGYDPYGQWQAATGMKICVDSHDRIYVADLRSDVRNIFCFNPMGEVLWESCTEVEPLPKSEEELDRQLEFARDRWFRATGSLDGFGYEPDPYHNAIRSLQVDGSDRLWVGYGPDGTDYIVLSTSGNYLFSCKAVLPEWQECARERVWIEPGGFFSSPYNPSDLPIVYRLRLVDEV